MIEIPIISKRFDVPDYATIGSSGVDIRADIQDVLTIPPHETRLIPTSFYVAIPEGYELQIRSRSGLALKHGIVVAQGIGTIDSDYRGELGVILLNTSNKEYVINPGEKIAQMVLAKCEKIQWRFTNNLPSTNRGEGGFGSTGIK